MCGKLCSLSASQPFLAKLVPVTRLAFPYRHVRITQSTCFIGQIIVVVVSWLVPQWRAVFLNLLEVSAWFSLKRQFYFDLGLFQHSPFFWGYLLVAFWEILIPSEFRYSFFLLLHLQLMHHFNVGLIGDFLIDLLS